ncbi:MAG: TonB-dependent receptor [Sphingorhabdus sp.]
MKKSRLMMAGSVVSLAMLAAAPVFAQDQATEDQSDTQKDEEEEETGEVILVTGSRIARPIVEDSIVPVTSVSVDEILDSGDLSLGDALNDLPSLRSTFSQANSNRFIGTSGLSLLDLRGLGTTRTLILVNGQRHVTALPGDFRVDVNTIPFELLERIDVVTGGNSAIYGSDAVAGVVNFILRKDYDGMRITAQSSVTGRGDRSQSFIGGIYGKNFADGRGNVAVAAEFATASPLFNFERDDQTGSISGRSQFNRGPGAFTFNFLSNIKNGNISNGTNVLSVFCRRDLGVFGGIDLASADRCAVNADGTIVDNGNGRGANALWVFNNNGRLVRNQPDLDLRSFGSNNTVGGVGSTLRETGQLAPGLDRYTVNLLAHYEFSDAADVFVEAKWSRLEALQEGQPSFRFFDEIVRYDNAFLDPADAAFIRDELALPIIFGGDPNGFQYSRFNTDFGGRSEVNDRETYRIVAGLRGQFNDDWRYEISANYGRLDTFLQSRNQLIPVNFQNALDAVFSIPGDTTSPIVCRINIDADPTNDDAACVPINILGNGNASQAALDYVNFTSTRDEYATQFVATAFVSGDLSQLFELPGGPIAFAVGVEYRRETSFSDFDDFTQAGNTFLNIIPTFDPPAFDEKSVFGEVSIPLLADMPFFNELTISAAARYSDYNTRANKTFAWNAGAIWAPFEGLRIRGNYSRSVRVPTPGDLFSPASQNFAFIGDPCDIQNINAGSPNRAVNCTAIGLGPGVGFVNTPARAQSLPFLTGGNPLLEEEVSDSYTLGFIVSPAFMPGFSLTADYYNITVNNVIGGVGAQAVLNNCFDADPGNFPNNAFCPSIFARDPATNFFGDPVLQGGSFNFAALETAGIDVNARYTRKFDNGHRIRVRAIATYVLNNVTFLDIANPTVPNRVQSELGDPTFAAVFGVDYDFNDISLSYDLRYVGRQTIDSYENAFPFNGNPANRPGAFGEVYYPDVWYHDVRVDWRVGDKFTFYAGIDNLGDRLPPLGLTGAGGGSGIFDSFGRTLFAGVRVNFE